MHAPRLAVAIVLVLGLTGCGSDDTVMPGVTGLGLDVALSDIERAGFQDDVEIVGGGLFGVINESNWSVCEQVPAAGEVVTDAPRLTVDRACGDESPEPEETDPSEETDSPEADAYVYDGPQYEIVTVDEDQGPAGLTQFWVYTGSFDYSTDAYKDQVKLIIADIADIARDEGTAELMVEVVTDKEIALAESPSTYEDFIEEYGMDYAIDTIPKKEVKGWVASYTGGYDYNAGEPSDSAGAFEVLWRPYATAEVEKWKPEIAG